MLTESKPLILFDIDNTIIDMEALRILQREIIANALHISFDEAEDNFLEYYGTLDDSSDFSPQNLLKFLAEKNNADYDQLLTIFLKPENFQKVLFPEVRKVLTGLKKDNYQLGIYSQGNPQYQPHKLAANKLLEFFDPNRIYISERKMDSELINSLPANTIIIDDRAEVIEFLNNFDNVIPLQIIREVSDVMGPYVLNSLTDLFPMLDRLSHSENSIK